MSERFTAYLSDEERSLLDEVAARMRVTRNWVVRTAVREFLGLDPRSEPLLPVTTDTGGE